ncbi:6927_t:CDS:1 [Paraglomus occultum]|uniref:6927_t:CDS:1 n=1 Tax=Paraglomus occultum TaxID=144539 RepID=A0A9N8Z3C5_9GLOM|nr:6927_t:CDS:1 [Paraglomus occultum]
MSDSSSSPLSTPSPSSTTSTLDTSPLSTSTDFRSSYISSLYTHPRPTETTGVSLGCLVNASVTVVPNKDDPQHPPNYIYLFGGFDQYTDEVYNDLYRLNVAEMKWEDVIYVKGKRPSKRNDHSASLWNGNKLVIFGGMDDEDEYCNDVVILDLETMTWERPEVRGYIPQGRAKHSATIYNDKLYIVGGHSADGIIVSEDVNCLDLETWTWEPPFAFEPRHSHYSFIFNNKLCLYGGYTEDLDREKSLTMMDLDTKTVSKIDITSASAPGTAGQHFAQLCGDRLVVVVTECVKHGLLQVSTGAWALDMNTFEWRQYLGDEQIIQGNWHYFAMGENNQCLFLFGNGDKDEEHYLSCVLSVDLQEYGLVHIQPPTIGMDLGQLFNELAVSDFTLRSLEKDAPPIYCHKIILLARWAHFAKMLNSGMIESFSNTFTIPEPYSTVRAFIYYLYTDTLEDYLPVDTIADLMALGNLYLLPRLVSLCSSRIHQKIDVEHVARIYHRATMAGENGLKKRALRFMDMNFGRVSKTEGFRTLPKEVLFDFYDSLPERAKISVE